MKLTKMDKIRFDRMCADMPHLSPKLVNTNYTLREYTYFDDKPSLFDIIKRDNYLKCNGRTCYVESVIKRIEVDRSMITMPKNYSYFWVVKKQYVDEILKQHGLSN